MSFEQLETQEQERKKKKTLQEQKAEQFFLEKKTRDESASLLQDLARQMAVEFGIDIHQARQLISGNTEVALENLASGMNSLSTIQQEKLLQTISQSKNTLKEASKKTRESLRQSFEQNTTSVENNDYFLTKNILPTSLIERGKYPKSIGDQCIGLGIGLIDTTEAVVLFLYGLSKGVLLTPYHLYLIITGRAQYEGWKKV